MRDRRPSSFFLHAGKEGVIERLRRCDDPNVAITIVTKAEVLRACCDFLLKADDGEHVLRAQARLLRTEELLGQLGTVALDHRAAQVFSRLRGQRQFKKIGHVDLLLAGIALANRATLVTRNVRHFKQIPGLSVENWVD